MKYTLYSLISQTITPEKIIVWLYYGETVPLELESFQQFGVYFEYCDDIKSYKKLVPAILKYPGKYIVTADDDIFYKKNWLEELWKCHLKFPADKITHIAHRLKFDEKGNLLNYRDWGKAVSDPSGNLFPTGVGGTLYPPPPVFPDLCKSELFMNLCPKADDVWFFFMGFLAKQIVRLVPNPQNKLKYVDIYKEYGLNGKYSLQSENVGENLNDQQIRNVMNHYGIKDVDLILGVKN
ncbi:MAG: glycosyltransferase family 2 protein [Clostridia bacterium]|nr:glycosyltransferase family 2 protein [Clostridia bacterium]